MQENETPLSLRALARAMDRAVGQVAREAKQRSFPRHVVGGRTVYYLSEAELWRHRNIKERTRRRSPVPALEAQEGDIDWRQAFTVTVAHIQDGGKLPARRLFGVKVDALTGAEWDELARWMTYGVMELVTRASIELHGTEDIRASAPGEYFLSLFDHAGDQALCDTLNGWARNWAEQRHPEWQSAGQEAQPVSTKAGE